MRLNRPASNVRGQDVNVTDSPWLEQRRFNSYHFSRKQLSHQLNPWTTTTGLPITTVNCSVKTLLLIYVTRLEAAPGRYLHCS